MSLARATPPDQTYWAELGSDEQRGRIFGRYVLTERAYLNVHELVEVVNGSYVHRLEYAYYLIVDGFEIWGFERDPNHEAEGLLHHRHTENHDDRIACDRVTFKEVVEMAWTDVSARGMVI